jgi:heat shock protein HtpX
MFEQFPGATAVLILAICTPAALRWWWGRALAPLADDPVLPERLVAHARRYGAAGGVSTALIVLGWPSHALWAVPLIFVVQMLGGYPLRKHLYQETWSFAGYLSFYGRLTAALFGFWIVLAATPWIASRAGRHDWAAGLALAALLLVLNQRSADMLRRLLRVTPVKDVTLVARFEALAAACGLPMPRFECVEMGGGFLANAVALPSLRRSSVIFTDTLLSRLTADETVAICAHELAHLEYYDRARLRRMTHAAWGLIAIAVSITPASRIMLGSARGGTGSALFLVALFVVMMMRAKHRRKNETASDLRAVELTGDPEALASALATLHTIARVPRRFDRELERHATHPSLARRIHDIRAAAGIVAPPMAGSPAFHAANGAGAVAFEDDRLAWTERPGMTHLLDYAALAELRLHATAGGAVTLVARVRGGRQWQMAPRAEDLPQLNALLDRVDGRLAHETPAVLPFSTAVSRLIAILAVALGWLAGQIAFGLVAMLAAFAPAAALLNAAAAAAFTAAAVAVRDGVDEHTGFAAVLLVALGAALLAAAWVRRGETSRLAGVAGGIIGVGAALAVVAIGLGGFEPIRLHQGARAVPSAAILLAALAAACFTGRARSRLRYAAAAAGLAGASVAVLGSTVFLDAVVKDPFLVAASPVKWMAIDAPPLAEFDVPFDIEQLRLSPHGRLVAARPTTPEESDRNSAPASTIHVGRPGGMLTPMEAVDLAFLDDRRAMRLVVEGSRAEVQEVRLDGAPTVSWRQPIERVRWGSIGVEPGAKRWSVTGRADDGSLIHASGIVGEPGVKMAAWDGTSEDGGWVAAIGVRGDAALVVEHQYSYGPFPLDSRFAALAILMARPLSVTRFARLRGTERADSQQSLLDARCLADPFDDGQIACTAFDGVRTRIVAIDPATAAVAPLASVEGRFVAMTGAAGGWLTGWTGSTPTALRPFTREAIRAPAPLDDVVSGIAASDAAIGTVVSTDSGSRVRIYPLVPAPVGTAARAQ